MVFVDVEESPADGAQAPGVVLRVFLIGHHKVIAHHESTPSILPSPLQSP